MTEIAIRSRMMVLVVAALLSIASAFGASAFLAADDASARYCEMELPRCDGGRPLP
jgi:hypothetical protein